jgi:hypothetical protein
MFPIYIPSRDRAGKIVLPSLLDACGLDYFIVVEPQFRNKYVKQYGPSKLLTLPKNNGGLPFVRNWITKRSVLVGDKFHWQIDDSVDAFFEWINKKKSACKIDYSLRLVEKSVLTYKNIGQAGIAHELFAWAANSKTRINKSCNTVLLMANNATARWRDNCVEDTDYSMQILNEGLCTMEFNAVAFHKPNSGSMAGGAKEVCYSENGPIVRCEGTMKLWPGCFKSAIRNGRTRLCPSRIWSTFKQRPIPVNEEPFQLT